MHGAIAQKTAHVRNGAERHGFDGAERDDRRGVTVYDRMDVRPRTINFAVNESFQIGTPIVVDEIAIQIERLDVVAADERRRHVSRKQEAIRLMRMTNADVAERIEHALVEQNVIRVDQVLDQLRIDAAGRCAVHAMFSRHSPSACCTGRSEKLNSTLASLASCDTGIQDGATKTSFGSQSKTVSPMRVRPRPSTAQ